jgi:hypothetical protein
MPCYILDEEFGPLLTPEVAAALAAISPRQIERRLAGARAQLRLKRKSTTKHGELLKNQVSVRAYFAWAFSSWTPWRTAETAPAVSIAAR